MPEVSARADPGLPLFLTSYDLIWPPEGRSAAIFSAIIQATIILRNYCLILISLNCAIVTFKSLHRVSTCAFFKLGGLADPPITQLFNRHDFNIVGAGTWHILFCQVWTIDVDLRLASWDGLET